MAEACKNRDARKSKNHDARQSKNIDARKSKNIDARTKLFTQQQSRLKCWNAGTTLQVRESLREPESNRERELERVRESLRDPERPREIHRN